MKDIDEVGVNNEYDFAYLCLIMGERGRSRLERIMALRDATRRLNAAAEQPLVVGAEARHDAEPATQAADWRGSFRQATQALLREVKEDRDFKFGTAYFGMAVFWWRDIAPAGPSVGINLGGAWGAVIGLLCIFMPVILATVSGVYSYRSLLRDLDRWFRRKP